MRTVYTGGGKTVRVTQKRPKSKSAVIGMAKAGMHDNAIREAFCFSRSTFVRLKKNIVISPWIKGGWW